MTTPLKPCPFCGEEKAKYFYQGEDISQYFYQGEDISQGKDAVGFYIYCANCWVGFTLKRHFTRTDALEAWNRRVKE